MKLWTNGHFHTMVDETSCFNNVLTNEGKIVAANVNEADYPMAERIDLGGHHVYPGMVDAHLHLIGYGQKLARIDLSKHRDKKAIIEILMTSHGEQIIAEGYHDIGITKFDLDKISDAKPIVLTHNDYHSVTVNSVSLKIANVDSPTGILTEDEAKIVTSRVLTYDKTTLKRYFATALKQLHENGITGGHSDDLSYFGNMKRTYEAIDETLKELPFRAHLLVHYRIFDQWRTIASSINNPYLEYGAVKLFYDGTLSSKTALVTSKYCCSDQQGLRVHSIDEFKSLVAHARSFGYTVAMHVIGDKALDEVCDILLAMPPRPGQKDRIIHASLATKNTIKKLTKLPAIFDIQPLFVTSDMPYMNRLFVSMPKLIYPWKSYLDQGLILLGSSDAPVEDPNPLLGIHALVTRQSSSNGKVYHPTQRIDRFQATKMYTTDYAVITNNPTMRGYIDIGYLSDFTVYAHDILTCPLEKLKSLKPSMTVIDEKIVYKTINQ
jgi:predicted amidohydrolase YtcJ